MAPVSRFEELKIWQEARAFANAVYSSTESLRDFEFRNQIRSAALSVMNNIAEGFERGSDVDFARFLDMAKGSAGESRSMLYFGEDRGYYSLSDAERLRAESVNLAQAIAKLACYLRRCGRSRPLAPGS